MESMITIDEEQLSQRLDVVAASHYPQVSRAYVRKLVDNGLVQVHGKPSKSGYKVRMYDVITLPDISADLNAEPAVIDLPIIYEDDDCVVMNKPLGLLTHARGGEDREASVASFLRKYVSDLTGDRAGIVHRLDRATSGVIIGAKTPEALAWLQKQFSQRKVKKSYVAIVAGHLKQPEAIIDMPIERNPKAPATFRVGPNGKSANTHYLVEQETPSYSLLLLRPETGRTHQLRVHLAQVGHPIVGDTLYDGKPAERLYLHAQSLEITLPSRERRSFEAATPAAFAELLRVDS
jgi:23S rRNA pseudouridine1911/1915/1917 synthase